MICQNCNFQMTDETNFCPNCGNETFYDPNISYLPNGENLLNGLYVVQNYLQRINDKLIPFWDLERYYQREQHTLRQKYKPNITATTVKDKFQYGLFVTGTAIFFIHLLIGLTTIAPFDGIISIFTGFFCLFSIFLFTIGKTQKASAPLIIGGILLTIFCLTWLQKILKTFLELSINTAESSKYIFINILAFVIAIIVTFILVKIYNKKTREYNQALEISDNIYNDQVRRNNEAIDQKRRALSAEITSLADEMQAETSFWYPVDYYVLDSVAKFISIVKNHEASTIKEMLKVYKEDNFRILTLNNQEEIKARHEQFLMNQQEMFHLQRMSNMIQMANLAANLMTASNTSVISNSMAAIQTNTALSANAAVRTADASVRTANATEYVANRIRNR